MLYCSGMEGNGPVRGVVAHRRGNMEALWQFGINAHLVGGIHGLCKFALSAFLCNAVCKHIILDGFIGTERLVKIVDALLRDENCIIILAINLIVCNMVYNGICLLLVDKANHFGDKLLGIIFKHVELIRMQSF